MSLDSDRFQSIMKSLGSDMRALADDLKLPVNTSVAAAAAQGGPGSLSSATLASLADLTQKRYAELGSDGAMSMQAEVGTQDSLITDQETLDKREVDVATVVRSLMDLNDDVDLQTSDAPEPSAPPLELEDDDVASAPPQPLMAASVSTNDPAEIEEHEADAIYKVMSYKLRDIQARAFTAIDVEVTSLQKRLLQKHHVEKIELTKKHEDATASLRDENAKLKQELERLRTERNDLLFSTALRGEKMGQQCLKVMQLLKSDYSLMNCFRRLQKHARENKYLTKVSTLSTKLSRHKEEALAFSKLRRHMHEEQMRRVELEAQKRLQEVCQGIMHRYEAELTKMRQQLAQANDQIDRSMRQRRQLEESLRQTLMRGMSSMQLEALDLFRDARAREVAASQESDSSKQRPQIPQVPLIQQGRAPDDAGPVPVVQNNARDAVEGEQQMAIAAEAQTRSSSLSANSPAWTSSHEQKPKVIHGGVQYLKGRTTMHSRGNVIQGSTAEAPRKRVPRPTYR